MIEEFSLGAVAIASIGLSALLVKKQSERDKRMAESLNRNSSILDELKIFLVRLNGRIK